MVFRERIAAAVAVILGLAAPTLALEKSVERAEPREASSWNLSADSCSVYYYNLCTGLIWVWSGWPDGAQMGTVFRSCVEQPHDFDLTSTFFYFRTGAPPGYGFTGSIAIHGIDSNGCPTGSPIASQPKLPRAGWNVSIWGYDIDRYFAIVHTFADENGLGSPVSIATDGPAACGVCFPTTRTTHSFTWGTVESPLCPGSPMSDGDCFVEFLSAAEIFCPGCPPLPIEGRTWGRVKALYR